MLEWDGVNDCKPRWLADESTPKLREAHTFRQGSQLFVSTRWLPSGSPVFRSQCVQCQDANLRRRQIRQAMDAMSRQRGSVLTSRSRAHERA